MPTRRMDQLRDTLDHASRRMVTLRPSWPLRYGVPFAGVGIALAVAAISQPFLPGSGVFLILLLPVIGSAVFLGFRSGLLALNAGTVGAFLLVPLAGHPWLTDAAHLLRAGLYLILGILVLLLAQAFRVAAGGRRTAVLTIPLTTSVEALTAREQEVLTLAASGLSTRAIGERLFVSENTVKSHLARIYGKLGARNRAEAVSAGLVAGWISADRSPIETDLDEVR